jgi:hypothetical protein
MPAPPPQLARRNTSHDAVFDPGVLGDHDSQDLIDCLERH